MRTLPAACLSFLLAAAAAPAEERLLFDVYLGPLRAGELEITGNAGPKAYNITGRMESTGVLGALRKVRYDAEARGAVENGRFRPRRYTETADTGSRASEALLRYDGDLPSVRRYTPPRAPSPEDVDPATQRGTVDPLTGLFATLRDAPAERACARDIRMFDGRRATRMQMSPGSAAPDRITCTGVYERVAGYSAEDLAEQRRFPFTATLRPGPDGRWQVELVEIDSLYGRARIVRR